MFPDLPDSMRASEGQEIQSGRDEQSVIPGLIAAGGDREADVPQAVENIERRAGKILTRRVVLFSGRPAGGRRRPGA